MDNGKENQRQIEKDTPKDVDFCKSSFWERRFKESKSFEMAVQKVDWNSVNLKQEEIINRHCSGRVLDAGCGYGRITKFLGNKITDYIGIDCTPFFINEARRKFPKRKFILGDIRGTEFDDKSFDWGIAIGMADSIYWPEMKKELQRICKKVIVLWCEGEKEYEIL